MSDERLKIWCNNLFIETQADARALLADGVGAHEVRLFEQKENGRAGVSRESLKTADIAFGTPDAETLFDCPNLRWIHINSAGYTDYDRADLREFLRRNETILTNSSSVYDEPCAEHLLAMILSFMRGLPFAHDVQRDEKTWPMHETRAQIRLAANQNVLILGFGAIGRQLAKLLAPLKMNVVGVKRTIRADEPIKVISETEIDDFLPQIDHLVNILPANDSTANFISGERLAKLKRGAFFYNIGRGSTVDQNALGEFLRSGHLGGAYLDVTTPEPLPPEHFLWTTPNCYITPHAAGGHLREKEVQVRHFLENLRRFERGENLLDRIQ